jgi:hypothetical protein
LRLETVGEQFQRVNVVRRRRNQRVAVVLGGVGALSLAGSVFAGILGIAIWSVGMTGLMLLAVLLLQRRDWASDAAEPSPPLRKYDAVTEFPPSWDRKIAFMAEPAAGRLQGDTGRALFLALLLTGAIGCVAITASVLAPFIVAFVVLFIVIRCTLLVSALRRDGDGRSRPRAPAQQDSGAFFASRQSPRRQ